MSSPVILDGPKTDTGLFKYETEKVNDKRPEDYEKLAKISFEHCLSGDHSVQHSLHRGPDISGQEASLKDQLNATKRALGYNSELQKLLWEASKQNDFSLWKEEIDRALHAGADINLCDDQGSYLVDYCSHDNNKVAFLLSRNIDPQLKNGRGNNLFFNMLHIGNINHLIEATKISSSDLHRMQNTHGDTLFTAYIKKKLSTITRDEIEFFFSKGFVLTSPIPQPEFIESIIHYLARTSGGHTALCMIYRKGVETFLDSRLRTPLDVAMLHGEWESALTLIGHGSTITPQNFKTICEFFPADQPLSAPLHTRLALAILNSQSVDFTKYHWSRTHFAARCNIWRATIRPDNLNSSQDTFEQTPLHIAAYYENFATAFCLLEAGADSNKDSKRGKAASLSAIAGKPKPVDELLIIYRTIQDKTKRAEKIVQLCEKYSKDDHDDFSIVKNIVQSP